MYSQNCTQYQGYVTTKPRNTVQCGGLIKTGRVAFTAHNIEDMFSLSATLLNTRNVAVVAIVYNNNRAPFARCSRFYADSLREN